MIHELHESTKSVCHYQRSPGERERKTNHTFTGLILTLDSNKTLEDREKTDS